MKIDLKYKFMAGVIIVALFAGKAQAQETKTTESVGSQYVNGTVPGLKYGPAKKAVVTKAKRPGEGRETIRTQFKNENIPGMRFAKGSGMAKKRPAPVDNSAAKTLPSALPAKVYTEKQKPVVMPVPTQEEASPATKKAKS